MDLLLSHYHTHTYPIVAFCLSSSDQALLPKRTVTCMHLQTGPSPSPPALLLCVLGGLGQLIGWFHTHIFLFAREEKNTHYTTFLPTMPFLSLSLSSSLEEEEEEDGGLFHFFCSSPLSRPLPTTTPTPFPLGVRRSRQGVRRRSSLYHAPMPHHAHPSPPYYEKDSMVGMTFIYHSPHIRFLWGGRDNVDNPPPSTTLCMHRLASLPLICNALSFPFFCFPRRQAKTGPDTFFSSLPCMYVSHRLLCAWPFLWPVPFYLFCLPLP